MPEILIEMKGGSKWGGVKFTEKPTHKFQVVRATRKSQFFWWIPQETDNANDIRFHSWQKSFYFYFSCDFSNCQLIWFPYNNHCDLIVSQERNSYASCSQTTHWWNAVRRNLSSLKRLTLNPIKNIDSSYVKVFDNFEIEIKVLFSII